jgi:drug/metabolite transporter (DMT)-like permease
LGLVYLSSSQVAVLEAFFTILFCLVFISLARDSFRIVINREIIAAGFLNAIGLILLFEGLARVHPAIMGFIGRLYFVYAMLIAYFYFEEKANKVEIILTFSAIAGVFLISFKNSVNSSVSAVGILMAILYPGLFAIQNAVIKSQTDHYDPNTILLNTKLYALAPLVAYSLIRLGPTAFHLSAKGSSIILGSTFLSTFLGLILFYRAFRLASFGFVNLMKAMEPVFVLGLSYLFFPFKIDKLNIIGIILILISVGGVTLSKMQSVEEVL